MIDSFVSGKIVIDGKEYRKDVIIYPSFVQENWWRKESHSVCMGDIKEIIEFGPDVVVFGKGISSYMQIPKEINDFLREKEITVLEADTEQASKIYNSLLGKKKVVAAFHLTC